MAYLRTALSFIAFGFVIARFSLFAREISVVAHIAVPNKHASTIFGTAMALAGIFVGIYGVFRYIATDAALQRGESIAMPPWAAILDGAILTAIGIVVAIDLFAFR